MRPLKRRTVPGLAQNALAGSVIFLLGVPLSLGAALASGVEATHGLLAAAIGGLVTGAVGGAPLMVTGPVVALAAMALGITQRDGFSALCAVTAVAGLLQLGFASLRLGRLVQIVHPAILEGVLGSVGLVLVLSQLHVLCASAPTSGLWSSLVSLPGALAHAEGGDLLIAAVTIGVVLLWNRTPGHRLVPSVLVAIVAVVAGLALFDAQNVRRVHMPSASWRAALPDFREVLHRPERWGALLSSALELALVCSLYSLLSAVTVDALRAGHPARLNRELAGQGAANLFCGLLGGLPVSGAVLRSSANLEAGATSRAAVMFQGVLMLAALSPIGGVLRAIPVACLAAFFLMLGLSLLKLHQLRALFRDKQRLLLYGAALVGALAANLATGVLCGLLANLVHLGLHTLRLSVSVEQEAQEWRLRLRGVASFMGVPRLTRILGRIPPGKRVHVNDHLTYKDEVASAVLTRWRESYTRAGGHVDLAS